MTWVVSLSQTSGIQSLLSPLKWGKKDLQGGQDLNELEPQDPDFCKMLPIHQC